MLMGVRKSLIISAIIAAFNVSVQAGGIETPVYPFSGAYLGVGLGPQFLFGKVASDVSTLVATGVPVFLPHTAYFDSANPGFIGNLHFGYGHAFQNRLYLGGEVFGEWSTTNARIANSLLNFPFLAFYLNSIEAYKIRAQNAYGISFRPGLCPTEKSLMYLVLGYSATRLKVEGLVTGTIQASTPVDPPPPQPLAVITNNHHKTKSGFRVGFGTAFSLAQHWIFRLEYFYTGYARLQAPTISASSIPIVQTIPIPVTQTATYSVKMSAHTVMAHIDYLF